MPETAQAIQQALTQKKPRSLEVAQNGVKTSKDFINLMSATISDVLEGQVTPQVAGVVVGAGRNILKAAELQLKYGAPTEVGSQNLKLIN